MLGSQNYPYIPVNYFYFNYLIKLFNNLQASQKMIQSVQSLLLIHQITYQPSSWQLLMTISKVEARLSLFKEKESKPQKL